MVYFRNFSKSLKKQLVLNPLLFRAGAYYTKDIPRIFMYHRFSLKKDPTGRKIDSETFEWQLNILKSGWKVIKVKDYLKRMKEGKSLQKIVVLTIDDGYCDFFDIAFPLLKKYF